MPKQNAPFTSQKISSPKTINPPIRVACIGDSITELSGYTNYTAQKLGNTYAVGNFGVCGSTVSLDSESPYMYSKASLEAQRFQPNIAVIMLGTNDANPTFGQYGGNFVEDYLLLVEKFQSLSSKPVVWVVKPPPIFGEVGLSGEVLAKEVLPALEKVAKRANLQLIDVYSALKSSDYFFDGVHPNDEGARVVADVVCKAITLL